ncbi:MAG: hypothetical protein JKY08_06000 [Flavobacteriaceae bacterium]|nr:hypothetical protein [Flavobacteriaceae bacterium]
MSRPTHNDKDVYTQKPGFFSWIREKAYDFVYNEGDFALQFTADLIRGVDLVRENKHLKRQVKYHEHKKIRTQSNQSYKPERPLTTNEQLVFVEIVKRKAGEPQMIYWKRKRILLASNNKLDLITQHKDMKKNTKNPKIKVDALSDMSIAKKYQKERVKTKTSGKTRKR